MKKINKVNLFAAFAITVFIFFSGFYLSDSLTKSKLGELQEIQDFLNVESASIEAQYDLALKNPCNLAGLTELNKQLNSFGDKLTYLETISPKNDQNINNLYNYYTVLEVKHLLFIGEVNKECPENYPMVLYFYSNNEDICPSCGMQGLALTALKKDIPETMIYSFNMDSNSKVVGTLKQMYNISTVPTLIINDDKSEGFKTRKQVEDILS